jgi:hypothetical protein
MAVLVFAGFALAGCGGGGDSASQDELVDALADGLMADPERPDELTREHAECTAEAFFVVYEPSDFEDAGLELEDLQEPDPDLSDLPAPSDEQAEQIGAAIQDCELGVVFGASFAAEVGTDEAGAACVGERFNTDDSLRRFLGASLIDEDADLQQPDARALTDVLVECADFARRTLAEANLGLTDAEIDCTAPELEDTDAFRDAIAAEFAGAEVSENDQMAAVLPALTKCLTPQRLVELGLQG